MLANTQPRQSVTIVPIELIAVVYLNEPPMAFTMGKITHDTIWSAGMCVRTLGDTGTHQNSTLYYAL